MSNIKTLELDRIQLFPDAQPRAELSSQIIEEYAEAMKSGERFPPLSVVETSDGSFYLWDGWHRFHALKRVGSISVQVEIIIGDRKEAVILAAGANQTHGMRRTPADKRRSVGIVLRRFPALSDREIARRCGVTADLVGDVRRASVDSRQIAPASPRIVEVERGGTAYEMRVAEPRVIEPAREVRPGFNLTNDSIGWVMWTWNPVTGCEHGCKYCYAEEISKRFYGPDGFRPKFHEDRIVAPKVTNPRLGSPGGDKVFVCSMADLFGQWVPNEWIFRVMRAVEEAPQWTFLFLTKNPKRLASVTWPDNAWAGASVDVQSRVTPTESSMAKVNARVRFVSVEPMLEPIRFHDLGWCDWVIVGAQSAANGQPEFNPPHDWHEALTAQAKAAGCSVYHKANLKQRRMEWPSEDREE